MTLDPIFLATASLLTATLILPILLGLLLLFRRLQDEAVRGYPSLIDRCYRLYNCSLVTEILDQDFWYEATIMAHKDKYNV